MTDKKRFLGSFVARIWLERGSNGRPQWRGHIQHVQGKEEGYFQDLVGMSAFLERVSGVPAPGVSEETGEDAAASGSTPAAGGKRKQ